MFRYVASSLSLLFALGCGDGGLPDGGSVIAPGECCPMSLHFEICNGHGFLGGVADGDGCERPGFDGVYVYEVDGVGCRYWRDVTLSQHLYERSDLHVCGPSDPGADGGIDNGVDGGP